MDNGEKDVLLDRILPKLAPDTGLLEPTERNVGMKLVRAVNL